MYPRNAASPERIAIGQVVLIADGTIQSAGVAVTVRGQGGAEAGSAGTIAYGADNTVYYTPTQAETNYTSFVVIASKASCFSVSQTIVTTASATPGKVVLSGETHTSAVIPTVTTVTTVTNKTGYSLSATGADLIAFDSTFLLASAKATWTDTLTTYIDGMAGKRLRGISSLIIREDTAQGPGTGTNQIQLDTGASAVDGSYDPSIISLVGGTGAGQSRLVFQYEGSTKIATVDRDWKVLPDATSAYVIVGDAGREHVNEGLAQGGGASTITLNALASAVNDAYKGQTASLRGGTGADQAGRIIAYNGTTKIATVSKPWVTIPNTTTVYAVLPTGVHDDSDITDALATDTYSEPGAGAPAATTTLAQKISYLYKWARNKKDNDGSTTNYYADDGSTVDNTQTTTESGGTVTKGEIV
jgi:hypothetical protein